MQNAECIILTDSN